MGKGWKAFDRRIWTPLGHIFRIKSIGEITGLWQSHPWAVVVTIIAGIGSSVAEWLARRSLPEAIILGFFVLVLVLVAWRLYTYRDSSKAKNEQQTYPITLGYGTTAYEDGRFLSAKSIGGEDMGDPVVIALTNTQDVKGGAAKQVVVKIEFDHDGGDHYTIRKAAWYILNGELFSGLRTAIDLESKESQSFRLFFKGPDGIVISENSVFPVGKLQEGHWSARMYASSVNSVTAYARASFNVFPGGRYEVMKIRSMNLRRDS